MKILVCDGDGSSRAVVRRLLMLAHGCDVSECASGAEALDALTAAPCDALLLETELPVLDGFETLAILRETPELRDLPVIMVTGDRSQTSVERAIELGVADYILKPIRIHRLQAGLRAVMARSQPGGRPGVSASSSVTIDAKTRVMVVDGDADFREFFSELLSPYCTVLQATTGASALTAAWVSVPSLVFIGRALGPVGAAQLVRNLGRLGPCRFIKLSSPEELAEDRAAGVFDDVVGRTLVPSQMLRDLKRFIAHNDGPLHRLLGHAPDLRSIMIKSTASTFGMMLSQEVDVVEPGDTDVVGAFATVDMVVAGETSARVEIQCASELTRQLASATFGDDVDVQTAVGVLGEIANVVTGRVQATLFERGVTCTCSLPQFGVGKAAPHAQSEDAERLVIELAPVDSGYRFRIVLEASLVDVAAADGTVRMAS